MCSSPKSSGNVKPRISSYGFVSSLSSDALSRFAACANAADERKQLRLQSRRQSKNKLQPAN